MKALALAAGEGSDPDASISPKNLTVSQTHQRHYKQVSIEALVSTR
jgi:hypothetical protein